MVNLVPTFWEQLIFSYYFQLTINLVPTVNSLMEVAYVTNGVRGWHIGSLRGK